MRCGQFTAGVKNCPSTNPSRVLKRWWASRPFPFTKWTCARWQHLVWSRVPAMTSILMKLIARRCRQEPGRVGKPLRAISCCRILDGTWSRYCGIGSTVRRSKDLPYCSFPNVKQDAAHKTFRPWFMFWPGFTMHHFAAFIFYHIAAFQRWRALRWYLYILHFPPSSDGHLIEHILQWMVISLQPNALHTQPIDH